MAQEGTGSGERVPLGFAEISGDGVDDAISVMRLARGMGIPVTDDDIRHALETFGAPGADNEARVRAALPD